MAELNSDLEKVLTYRQMEPGDVSFFLDSLIKCYRESPWAGVVGNHQIYDTLHETVEQLLARGATVEMAVARHDPKRILGYCFSEQVKGGYCVHFVYIKDAYRCLGLASELLRRAKEKYGAQEDRPFHTFRTEASGRFQFVFAPEIARRLRA